MDKTQLPAEIENKIFNVLICHTHASRAVASKELAQLFAAEYAKKLQQAEQEIEQLKRWKMEAVELLNPILEYGQYKEAAIPSGQSITNVVLERCKRLDAAHALLSKFISRHEAGLLPDRFIYDEIKTFLDGTK